MPRGIMAKLRDNGLSLVLATCFLIFWMLQDWSGYLVHNKDLLDDKRSVLSVAFLGSFLFRRGSAESKDPDKTEEADKPVTQHLHAGSAVERAHRRTRDAGAPAILRRSRTVRWLYRYSLSLAFLLLCAVSFSLRSWGGYFQQWDEAAMEARSADSFREFLTGAEFWFQAMQNWQSEFLAVLSIVVLSIWLPHHGSPESKKVWEPHQSTGKA